VQVFQKWNSRKLPRRAVLHLAAGAGALLAMPHMARAQAYPSRPVRWIVPFPAGGVADILARLIGQWLSERLGQPVVVENRPGAGGNVGTEAVVRATPDGHTLLWLSSSNAISSTLYDKLNFDFLRDIVPAASIVRTPLVMAINPAIPAKTVLDFVAYAKANSGKVNMASGGKGTTAHLAGEMFNMMTGIRMVHVPYRGSAPALTDLIGGQVHVIFDPLPSSIGYIRANQLRALAVTTATRLEALPDIPAVGEFVSGYEASAWQGLGVPKHTSAQIVDRLNNEINAALSDPQLKARVADLGSSAFPSSALDFRRLIAAETEKWGKVVRFSGVKPD
jgi:tripartite-type tricarboxylate transporter receptor subunit TctC